MATSTSTSTSTSTPTPTPVLATTTPKYLVDENHTLIKTLTKAESNWYKSAPDTHYRVVENLKDYTLASDLNVSRVGDNLVVIFSDGAQLVALNYFNCGADDVAFPSFQSCSLTVAADDPSGYSVPSGAGSHVTDNQIVYHHGDQSAFKLMIQSNSITDEFILAQTVERLSEPAVGPLAIPLWVSLTGGAVVLGSLSGGSGSDSGTSIASNNQEPQTQPENAQFTLTGLISAGPVIEGHDLWIKAYNEQGTLLDTLVVNSSGAFVLKLPAEYEGLVLLQAFDIKNGPDYVNEANAEEQDLVGDLRSIIKISSNGPTTVQINPLTELAVSFLGLATGDQGSSETDLRSVTEFEVNNAMATIAAAFGLTELNNVTPLLTIDATKSPTENSNDYGKALALLSGMALNKSMTSPELLKMLGKEIQDSSTQQLNEASAYEMVALAQTMDMGNTYVNTLASNLKLPNASKIAATWTILKEMVKPNSETTSVALTQEHLAIIGVNNAENLNSTTVTLVNTLLPNYSEIPTSMDSVSEIESLVEAANAVLNSVNKGPVPSLENLHQLGLTQVTENSLGIVQKALGALANTTDIDEWSELSGLVNGKVTAFEDSLDRMQQTNKTELEEADFINLGIDVSGVVSHEVTDENGVVDHLSYLETSLVALNNIAQNNGTQITPQQIEAAVGSYGHIFDQLTSTTATITTEDFANVGITGVTTENKMDKASLSIQNASYSVIDTHKELQELVDFAVVF